MNSAIYIAAHRDDNKYHHSWRGAPASKDMQENTLLEMRHLATAAAAASTRHGNRVIAFLRGAIIAHLWRRCIAAGLNNQCCLRRKSSPLGYRHRTTGIPAWDWRWWRHYFGSAALFGRCRHADGVGRHRATSRAILRAHGR